MSNYEYVNSPSHYKNSDEREAIDIIIEEYGLEEAAIWCKITARKYELRKGRKPGESLERDMQKRDWYLNKYNELKSLILCQKIPGLLTSQEVLENIVNSTVALENIQQHGIDLNLIKVFKLDPTSFGCVSRTKSTELSNRVEITPNADGYFELTPGSYDIVFEQGVNVKANNALFIRQRSSLTRNGCTISSSIYDAGFKTKHLGTVLKVDNPIKIELGARVGYLYGHHCESVDNLYNGQFQNK